MPVIDERQGGKSDRASASLLDFVSSLLAGLAASPTTMLNGKSHSAIATYRELLDKIRAQKKVA